MSFNISMISSGVLLSSTWLAPGQTQALIVTVTISVSDDAGMLGDAAALVNAEAPESGRILDVGEAGGEAHEDFKGE